MSSDGTDPVQLADDGVEVVVLASAGSSDSKVRGLHGGALKVAVRAAPEKGKANAEIEEVLARFFAVGKKDVSVVSGQTSRQKRVHIRGIAVDVARARVAGLG